MWCGLEGGSGQRSKVQENKWLSAKPVMPDSARPHANRMFRSGRAPRIELTRHHTNQPKREFLEYGKNREIRKIRNNEQKPELPKDPAKRKKESEENKKSRTKQATANPQQTQSKEMRRCKCDLRRMGSAMRARQRKDTD